MNTSTLSAPSCGSVAPSVKQDFSLPASIIYYMTKNPSTSKLYSKMIQSCKYFFEKNSILVVYRMHNGTHICSNSDEECQENDEKCCINLDLSKIKSKIWLTNELHILSDSSNLLSLLRSKIYRSDITFLTIYEQRILFDDFKFFASSVTEVELRMVKIVHKNGSYVLLENILGAFPKIEKFTFAFNSNISVVTSSTLQNIINLQNLEFLHHFDFMCIPEIFDVKDFSDFIEYFDDVFCFFEFKENVSQEYKNQLDQLIDTIIESQIHGHVIWYPGQNPMKRKIMENRLKN
uniref:DUF38 domain-containing protein n=1 Tax=Panagrolaimus superbus TaxID=310955 RepID=A0A914YEP9_9BILA